MCSVVAILKKKDPGINLDKMIKKGVDDNGFTKNGWLHDYFVNLLKSRGFIAAHREQNMSYSSGIQKIADSIKKDAPVIVSGRKLFMDQMSFHMILITGVRLDQQGKTVGFYYIDPAGRSNLENDYWYTPIETFMQFWRQTAIFSA
jgi:hypothetical protein